MRGVVGTNFLRELSRSRFAGKGKTDDEKLMQRTAAKSVN